MKFDRYFLAIKTLLRAKYIFREPERTNLLIFDGINLEYLKYILPGYRYQIFQTRINEIKKIYIK